MLGKNNDSCLLKTSYIIKKHIQRQHY